MNKILLFFTVMLVAVMANAQQCDALFFSEYVEGYANNKALEVYNPTQQAVNLSDYSIVRFSNGNTSANNAKIIQLPGEMLAAGDVFVVVVDLVDTADWNTQFDKPAWNGYNLIDTLFDVVTGEPLIDDETGEVILGPQYLDGAALFGTEYNEEYDLQCKADAFLCPEYGENNTMYFNGNDAMALISGTEVAADGSNILDVIGVIGEDPEESLGEDAWVDENGYWLTKDRTLVRKANVATGRNDLNLVTATLGGTFTGQEWDSYRKNDFRFLGIHKSVCHSDQEADQFSCSEGPIVGTSSINLVAFNIYPNPNGTGTLNIAAEENIQSVEIINLMGQQVLTQLNDGAAYPTAIVDLNTVAKGVYVVKVHFDGNMVATQKLIVQ